MTLTPKAVTEAVRVLSLMAEHMPAMKRAGIPAIDPENYDKFAALKAGGML